MELGLEKGRTGIRRHFRVANGSSLRKENLRRPTTHTTDWSDSTPTPPLRRAQSLHQAGAISLAEAGRSSKPSTQHQTLQHVRGFLIPNAT